MCCGVCFGPRQIHNLSPASAIHLATSASSSKWFWGPPGPSIPHPQYTAGLDAQIYLNGWMEYLICVIAIMTACEGKRLSEQKCPRGWQVLSPSTGARVSPGPDRHSGDTCPHKGPSSHTNQSPHTSTFPRDLKTPRTALMMPNDSSSSNPYDLSFPLFSPLSESCVPLPTGSLTSQISSCS
jgi:hypothetical protein